MEVVAASHRASPRPARPPRPRPASCRPAPAERPGTGGDRGGAAGGGAGRAARAQKKGEGEAKEKKAWHSGRAGCRRPGPAPSAHPLPPLAGREGQEAVCVVWWRVGWRQGWTVPACRSCEGPHRPPLTTQRAGPGPDPSAAHLTSSHRRRIRGRPPTSHQRPAGVRAEIPGPPTAGQLGNAGRPCPPTFWPRVGAPSPRRPSLRRASKGQPP